jgi:exodeoxyribonuclease-3
VLVASWNVNSLRVRLPQVLAWLETHRPDVLGLQETKVPDEDFPAEALAEAGYEALFYGQRTYNGVALLTRRDAVDPVRGMPDFPDEQRRVIGATIGGVRVYNLYVPNGQSVDSDKYAYKLDWLAALRRQLVAELAAHPRLLVMGDFNIAPDDRDVHDPEAWSGNVLVSPKERAALQAISELGLTDAFRLFDQPESTFSWWDYRAAAFRRNRGLRIDLQLVSEPLAGRCRRATVDREPRGWERPSDHAPVLAEFELD